MEKTGSNLDVAIMGQGYYTVANGDQTQLTRDGRFGINTRGHLSMGINANAEILDPKGKPITLDPTIPPNIDAQGVVTQKGRPVGRIAVVDVPDPTQLTKAGGTMLNYTDMKALKPATGANLVPEFRELSNVEPSSELANLMDAQRQLEANANMIRYQDQMLSRLCNDVGKIS